MCNYFYNYTLHILSHSSNNNNNNNNNKDIVTKNNKRKKEIDLSTENLNSLKRQKTNSFGIWDDYNFTIHEKNDLVNNIKNTNTQNDMYCWISATRTKNYMLDDLAIDWLNLYYDKYGINVSDKSDNTDKTDITIKTDKTDKTDNTNKPDNTVKTDSKVTSNLNILFEGGNIFEKKVYEEMSKRFGKKFIIILQDSDMIKFRTDRNLENLRNNVSKVKECMIKGIPFIAQAPLMNENNNTFGVADILIRSDYLNKLFSYFDCDNEINVPAPLLKGSKYHYRVIDCKWTKMSLCVDGKTLRNDGLIPAYKGQLAVYTACLSSLQGYIPNYAYIMGKSWNIDSHKKSAYSAFDRPGVIDYAVRDNVYVAKTKQAIKWCHNVILNGDKWRYNHDKPSIPELYPNMNKTNNPQYDGIKNVLAQRYGEPTMIWFVGYNNRLHAAEQGIHSINDERCNTNTLGITSIARSHIIDNIIDINRNNTNTDMNTIISPVVIKNNMHNWQHAQHLEYFVDFETCNYGLYKDPNIMHIDNNINEGDISLMIGFGFSHLSYIDTQSLLSTIIKNISGKYDYYYYYDKVTNWEFICLYITNICDPNVDGLDHEPNNLQIYKVFFEFITNREQLYHKFHNKSIKSNKSNISDKTDKTRLFHWSPAEIISTDKAINKILHLNINTNTNNKNKNIITKFNQSVVWIDMCKVFEKEPIVIRGAFKFKLKQIGNAFYNNGLIDTHWDDGKLSDGFTAMLSAINLYRHNDLVTIENNEFMEIIKYNEIDCKVIWNILSYLRNNHCQLEQI